MVNTGVFFDNKYLLLSNLGIYNIYEVADPEMINGGGEIYISRLV